jgi:NADH-quinone oxidoreductase subunit N
MPTIAPELFHAIPELYLLGVACVLLLVDLFLREEQRHLTYHLALATLAGLAALNWSSAPDARTLLFHGSFVADPLATMLKQVCTAAVAVSFVYSRDYLAERGLMRGEYFVLGLTALLGMMVIISAHSLLTLYLGLELMSLSMYAMVALDRDSPVGSEAAMKYFVLGAIASGVLLYGMSLLYGIAGTLDVGGVASALAGPAGSSLGAVLALACVVIGLGFKFGAVPMHMWVPDVYHGSPTAVTLFIGSAPKVAAFALMLRLLVDGLGAMVGQWRPMLAVLALLSLAVGSFAAIAQTNLKRMLAYSTIGHVGFILLGFLSGSLEGYRAALFYTVTYVVMATAAFGLILLLARRGYESDALDDLKGLNRRSPWFALLTMFVMFSMAGVPPFVGFFAKLAVLWAAVDAGLTWLAVAAVAFSIISAFYYLRVVKLMYFDEPLEGPPVAGRIELRTVLTLNGLAVLLLGVVPDRLLALCTRLIG